MTLPGLDTDLLLPLGTALGLILRRLPTRRPLA